MKIKKDTPLNGKGGLVQCVRITESIGQVWVKLLLDIIGAINNACIWTEKITVNKQN